MKQEKSVLGNSTIFNEKRDDIKWVSYLIKSARKLVENGGVFVTLHLIFRDESVSVDVVELEGPVQLLVDCSSGESWEV
jgi:hypothetical protein